ncbi:MAG: ABC transporter substrate-binding protein [Promethearchaeota archaeon]
MSCFFIGFILLGFCTSNTANQTHLVIKSSKWASEFRPYGGYVDEIEFVIFTETEIPLAMLALQNGDIDAYDERILQDYLAALVRDQNIDVTFTPSVRYRALTLNCEKFPLNITAFRRAMAFGFDKYRANVECIGGVGQPQDGHIPISATEWEIDSEVSNHFYEADFASGNASLENAGFIDLDGDGWREFDADGSKDWSVGDLDHDAYADGDIIQLYASLGYDPPIRVCNIMVDGLRSMGIMAETLVDWFDYMSELWSGRGWALCWTEGITITNPSQLLYDNFRTDAKYNRDPYSYYHFSNATIDQVLDQMINSTSLEDTKSYAKEAASLLAFEQPQIVCYNDVNINAYRTDKFEGFFEFKGIGSSSGDNPYLMPKVFRKESEGGPYGGTFKYCLSGKLNTLNPYLYQTDYDRTVFQNIYETLWNIDPFTWDPIPGLAYDWDIEQTIANDDIRDGQKYTYYLYQNETWHDGTPFTAQDVNVSILQWRSSPRSGPEMKDIYKIEIPDDYTIVIYVNETGFFEFADTQVPYIIPTHIYDPSLVGNITVFNPTLDDMIGTGPYKLAAHVSGEYISLEHNTNWRWDNRTRVPLTPDEYYWISSQSETETSSSRTSTYSDHSFDLLPVIQILELGTIVLFLVTLVIIIRRHQLN